jgi:hypothetical protein
MDFKKLFKLGTALGTGAFVMSQDGVQPPAPQAPASMPAGESRLPAAAPAMQEEKPALAKLEGLLKPRSPEGLRTLDLGNMDTGSTVAGLSKVQDARDMSVLTNQLGAAAELIGSGISRSKPVAQGRFDQQAKDADKIVKDFKDRGDQEKNDPNSGVSQAYRKAMERFGIKIQGNPSAATIEKVAPWIVKAHEGEENREARKAAMALALEGKKEARDAKKEEKELQLAVPGFERTGEVMPKPEEAVKFRKATATADQLKTKLKRLRDLVTKEGSFGMFGNDAAEMQSLATEVQLLAKSPEMYELGVLTGPDMSLLEKITADPSGMSSLFTRDKTRLKQIDTQLSSVDQKLGSISKSLGYKQVGVPEKKQQNDAPKPKTVIQNGHTYTLNEETGEYE